MAALYLSIASTLRHEVRDHYLAGEYLPPEKQLAARFAVNRHTLRRALDELVDDGLIIRQQGIGNQVAKPKVFYVLNDKASYTQNLSACGMRADTLVLECREATLNPVTAKRLGRPVDQIYVLLITQRHLNGCVACVIHHHLFDIDIEQLRLFSQGSLHQFLAEKLSLTLRRSQTSLRARMPNSEECEQLKIGYGSRPILEVHTRNVDTRTDALREYSVALGRSDFFEYTVEH